jgi:hypothetical protein
MARTGIFMRKTLIAAALATAAFAFPAAAQETTEGAAMQPNELVEAIYADVAFKDEKGCSDYDGMRNILLWFSTDLLMAYKKDLQSADSPSIDFDPFTNAQDLGDVAGLKVAVLKSDAAAAEVEAAFDYAGSKQKLVYVLKMDGNNWAIDDIKYTPAEGDAYSLRGLLAPAPQ